MEVVIHRIVYTVSHTEKKTANRYAYVYDLALFTRLR